MLFKILNNVALDAVLDLQYLIRIIIEINFKERRYSMET